MKLQINLVNCKEYKRGIFLCYVTENTLADIAETKGPHQNSVLWVKNCFRNALSLFCAGDRSLATPQTMNINVSTTFCGCSGLCGCFGNTCT